MSNVTRHHPKAKCENCPLFREDGRNYVPTEFNGNDLFVIGQAPGRDETKTKQPFTGKSGKLLEITLTNNGISRRDITLTNVVSCRPPKNDDPPQAAIECCRPRLGAEIALDGPPATDPTLPPGPPPSSPHGPSHGPILALGNTAIKATLKDKPKVTKDRVGPPKLSPYYENKVVIPTFHPAACLRNPDQYQFLETDVRKINNAALVEWTDPAYIVYEDSTLSVKIALEQILNEEEYNPLAIDLEVGEEKDDSFGHPEKVLSVGIAYNARAGIVIGERAIEDPKVRELLAAIIRTKKHIWHNAKYDLQVLFNVGLANGKAYWDTMLASYCIDERRGIHGLKYLAKEYLGAPDWDAEVKKEGFENVQRQILYKYNVYDAVATYRLYELQQSDTRWDDEAKKLFAFLMEAQHVLMHVEIEGIKVDTEALDDLEVKLSYDLHQTEKELQPENQEWLKHLKTKSRPTEFNPNSPQQVLARLKELGARLPNTDKNILKEALTKIPDNDPIAIFINKLLEHRRLAKLYGTYVKGVRERLHNGRMHTTFLLHGTTTGRTSSRQVNIQNVPRDKSIRRIYVPEEGNSFVQLDFANIEGRIVFVLSDCESGRNILEEGRDIHGEVAEKVYGPNYTKEQRTKAKSIVHGTNYARTPHGIARDPEIGLDLTQATELYNSYKQLVPEVFQWHKSMKQKIFSNDDLVTPFGRKRRFALVTDENWEDIYKEGLAFLPQSIASDITLSCVIELWKIGYKVRNFVHDSVILEVSDEWAELYAEEAKVIMEQIAQKVYTDWISFPVEYDIGKHWGEV